MNERNQTGNNKANHVVLTYFFIWKKMIIMNKWMNGEKIPINPIQNNFLILFVSRIIAWLEFRLLLLWLFKEFSILWCIPSKTRVYTHTPAFLYSICKNWTSSSSSINQQRLLLCNSIYHCHRMKLSLINFNHHHYYYHTNLVDSGMNNNYFDNDFFIQFIIIIII